MPRLNKQIMRKFEAELKSKFEAEVKREYNIGFFIGLGVGSGCVIMLKS
jgi:hypothetical protein